MDPNVRKLRKVLKSVDGIHVSRVTNDIYWATTIRATERGMREICAILAAANIHHECIGKPGTVGQYFVDVYVGGI